MTLEIILAGISLLFIIILVSIRYFSIAYAGGDSSVLMKTDAIIKFVSYKLKKFYTNTIEDLTELLKDLPHIFLHFLNRIFYKLYKKTKKLVDLIKGNRIRTDGGSVSLYLKNIENKK